MNIQIIGTPWFLVPLTLDDLMVLKKLSVVHYDAVCKAAAFPGRGGFLLLWWAIKDGQEVEQPISVSWREMDICCKILEGKQYLMHKMDKDIADRLALHFHAAMQQAQAVSKTWVSTYPAGPASA